MPSLFRFLIVIAVIIGAGYGALYALANLVHPQPREITVTVPNNSFFKDR